MQIKTAHPRIYFDCNSALAESSFGLVRGMLEDLQALGLTPETAEGSRFTFVQEDVGPTGQPDALIFNGAIARSATLGYFALADSGGVHWLSELSST